MMNRSNGRERSCDAPTCHGDPKESILGGAPHPPTSRESFSWADPGLVGCTAAGIRETL